MSRLSLFFASALALGGLSACQSGMADRIDLPEDGVSIEVLKGYDTSREKGSTVLRSRDKDKGGSTLIVRRVDYDERNDRSKDELVEATKLALEGYPEAVVKGPLPEMRGIHDAVRFELSFAKKPKSRKRYERHHAVVFGSEAAYHVIHTAPNGQLSAAAKDFEKVLDSLEEEG